LDKELCSDCFHSGNLKAEMKTVRLSRKAFENVSKLPGNTSCNACRILGEMLQNHTNGKTM